FILLRNRAVTTVTPEKKEPIRYATRVESNLANEGDETQNETDKVNSYSNLSVLTQLNRVNGTYFLVDCYHNQILYNDNLTDPIIDWKVMTRDMNLGHTIASDGTVYLVDDTENARILVFEKTGEDFVLTQIMDNVGVRPHYIVYNETDALFYAWSSMTGEMYRLKRDPEDTDVYLQDVLRVEALNGIYIRSFYIEGDSIYLISGNAVITVVNKDTFEVTETIPVPESISGMANLIHIGSYYYITVSTDLAGNQDAATFIRTKDLHNLINGDYEDIYSLFIGGGTPYNITRLDNTYYLTEHRLEGHALWSFQVDENDNIIHVTAIY
nr:hypothetical protein [Lachnospiraceae bacterium]